MLLLLACVHVVDVSIVGAEIAPRTANDAAWDGPDKMPYGALDAMKSLLSQADPSGQVGDAAVAMALKAEKPDAAGTATLLNDGKSSTVLTLAEVSDTLSPTWQGATFHAVTLNGKLGVRVVLADKDLSSDDAICSVDLTSAELARAAAAKGPLAIDTASRTSGQLLSVSLSIVPTPGK